MSSQRPRFLLLALALTLLIASCGGGEDDAAAGAATESTSTTAATATDTTVTDAPPEATLPAAPPSDYAGFVAQETACGGTAPEPVTPMTFGEPEDQNLDPTIPVKATITTSCGDIVVELDPSVAPETVNSFVFLARSGYFDGSVSHRVLPDFVMQAGDQSATGREGPGYTVPDELPGDGFVYETGVLAMANSGPNSTGSQFFIMLGDAPLPTNYSAFGNVLDGSETLSAIAAVPLGVNPFGEMSVPLETVYIERVTINE